MYFQSVFCRTFEPLWGVLRVATEKLANAHMQVVQKFQDLIKELKEYGDKQKERHKQVSCFVRLLWYCAGSSSLDYSTPTQISNHFKESHFKPPKNKHF